MALKANHAWWRRLLQSSRHGISQSVLTGEEVPYTGPNWASLYTGVQPEVHGITDAGWLLEGLKYQDIRVNTIFDLIDPLFSQALMTLPLTYPAFPVSGWMVSGFPTPKSLRDCFYPEEVGNLLPDGFVIDHAKCARGMGWDRIEDEAVKLKLKKTFSGVARSHVATFKRIFAEWPVEAAFVGLTYVDRINHLFVQKDASLLAAYSEIFDLVEELVDFCRPETLLICSDHGFAEEKREHDLYGFYLIRDSRSPGGRKDIVITELAPAVLRILGIEGELGIPVDRPKVKIKPGKMQEIKQRLKALGYI